VVVCLSKLPLGLFMDFLFGWGYLINKTPWNFDHLHSLKPYFLGLIYFVILWCWNRLLSLDHKYLNEPVMLEYVGVCFFRSYMHTTIGSTGVGMGLIHLSTSGAGCAWLAVGATKVAFGDVWLPAVSQGCHTFWRNYLYSYLNYFLHRRLYCSQAADFFLKDVWFVGSMW
jgi:hypothetical protein